MPYHKVGAYDGFDSVREAAVHYRRCRTRKHFILSAEGAAAKRPRCPVCRKPVVDNANRCELLPGNRRAGRRTRVAVMHYDCAWSALFRDILRLADRM
jgi:hypothetical protein